MLIIIIEGFQSGEIVLGFAHSVEANVVKRVGTWKAIRGITDNVRSVEIILSDRKSTQAIAGMIVVPILSWLIDQTAASMLTTH